MDTKLEKLIDIITEMENVVVAVSGGVDSVTLAHIAHITLGPKAQMVHATSSAVPKNDAERLERFAKEQGWNWRKVVAGEMEDERYKSNPINRCYYCKTHLFETLTGLQLGHVVSGTNLDDLGDFRPGLKAAKELDIRHPFVEAEIDKTMIRDIARKYKLRDFSDLPSSPCLASRVETGIRIRPNQLELINDIENLVRTSVEAENIRCRLRSKELVLEVDQYVYDRITRTVSAQLIKRAEKLAKNAGVSLPMVIAPYIKGSAFVEAV